MCAQVQSVHEGVGVLWGMMGNAWAWPRRGKAASFSPQSERRVAGDYTFMIVLDKRSWKL